MDFKFLKAKSNTKCSTFIKSVRKKDAFAENCCQSYNKIYKTSICVLGDRAH